MGKHIPGRPTIVPQNMAGAGSLRAANFIYSAAPKDGTAFGTFARTTGINPLLESGATFDGTKFTWLGSVTDDISHLRDLAHLEGQDLGDFLKKPTTLGGQAPSSEPDIFANLYKNVFGAPIKLVRRLSRHQRDHARHGARRGRRPVRAVLEHDQDPPRCSG